MAACGTAAFRKEPVISSDIAADPLWSGPAEKYRGRHRSTDCTRHGPFRSYRRTARCSGRLACITRRHILSPATNTITARMDNVADTLYHNHLNFLKDLAPEMGRNFRVVYSCHDAHAELR